MPFVRQGVPARAGDAFPPAPARPVAETELRAFGEQIGAVLTPPVLVALRGDVGAGKTTLAHAIARGAGVAGEVTSPTFSLVHEYLGAAAPVFHIDLYRIASPADLTNLAWDDIVGSHAIVLVEWPERAADRIPRPHLDVALRDAPDDPARRIVEVAWRT